MQQIHGKDWMLEIDEASLVRMAISALRQNGEKITIKAIAEIAGLPVSQVEAIMRQILAQRE